MAHFSSKFGEVKYNIRYSELTSDELLNCMASRLGTKIRTLRKEKGLTLDQLAEQAKLSKSYLWELENRESLRPSAEKLNSLADVLGVKNTYFLEEDKRTPDEQDIDEGFFRGYQQLDAPAKEHLRNILQAFKKTS